MKKVVQSFFAMRCKVTRSQSNHEMFSHLKTTTILLCFDLYKNEFSFAGFSSIVPKTLEGRLFCVLYALIGLPGTCLTLKSTGDKITDLFINLITNFEKHVLERSHLSQKVELKVALTKTQW